MTAARPDSRHRAVADSELENGSDELVAVQLLGFPLRVHQRAAEHHEGLMREFALLALDPPLDVPGHEVPARLRELIAILGKRYAGVSADGDRVRDEALEAGLDSVDLMYRVPCSAARAAAALDALLDETEEFCRQGDLLTLTSPPEALAFRRWYLGEFLGQLGGAPPTRWPGST